MHLAVTVLLRPDGRAEFRMPAGVGRNPGHPLVSFARDPNRQSAAVLVGRLLYREDLLTRLEVEADDDAALALAAYHAGDLARLEGEYALVIWDGAARCLVAHRDPLGSWPLFRLDTEDGAAVGTSIEALARLQPAREFDEEYLADFLMWPNPHAELPCERTAIQGVRRILPGRTVQLFADGQVKTSRWWDWDERVEVLGKVDREEAVAELSRRLKRAVKERARGTVAAHLSGGLDSSAVVGLAQEALAGQPLHTLSLVYDRPSLAGERQYIDLVLHQGRGLQSHPVRGEDAADYDWFRSGIPHHEEPYSGLPGAGADELLMAEAARAGATTVLSGYGSDEVLDVPPFHIAELLRRGCWVKALREARAWARAQNRGTWTVLRRYGFEPLCPLLLREGLRTWLRGGRGTWPRLGWFSVPPWVTPAFARKHHMAGRGREHARRIFAHPMTRSLERNMLETGAGDWARWHLAAPRGMHLSHPFQDPRLMGFALGLPARLRCVPGERKPLLRDALRGVVPEPIRTRRDKRGFDDIYGLGLSRNAAHLERMVRESPIRELGIIDVEALAQVVREAALGVADIRAGERMDKTLALIAWFDQARRCRAAEDQKVVTIACWSRNTRSERVGV